MSKTIQGYIVLPLKFSSSSSSHHELFIKEHSVRHQEDNKPAGKTLFVANVPPYATLVSLKRAFSGAGKVRYVLLQNSLSNKQDGPSTECGFKIAHVVFEKRESLLKALKLNSLNPLSVDDDVETGMSKWIQEYNSSIYDHVKLSQEVEAFMAQFDAEEEKDKNKVEVDDEGWTVVTSKTRNPGLARKESVGYSIQQRLKKKSKKRALKNFYSSQIRQNKLEALQALRKGYEESKEKIKMMKETRKFKPY